MLKFSRMWAMPSHETFSIKPIRELIGRYNSPELESADPFSNKSRLAKFCNDLDPQYGCEYQMDALDFLKSFDDSKLDLVLFDPPYSTRQVSECYKSLDKTVNMETTSSLFWTKLRTEVGRVIKPGGVCISCCWNSGGIGKKNSFSIEEIMLVAHGGWHNDTIVTVERKNAL